LTVGRQSYFPGWPDMSYGTLVEKFVSKFHQWKQIPSIDCTWQNEDKWPKQLSIGSGAQTIALLNNVPVWFELWRTLNGFPANYYTPMTKLLKRKIMKHLF
jgi:hypothetical protein